MIPEDRYIDVQGIRTRYWQAGNKGPVILLVHGIAASVEYWMYNINELAEHFQVYAVDMVGFGKTEKPKMDFTAEILAHFLREFLAALKIEKSSLVGHSLGGAVCLQFAMDYPEVLEKLVLVDSAGFGQDIPFGFRILTIPFLGNFLLKFDSKPLVARAIRAHSVNKSALTDEFVGRMYKILQLPGAKKTMLAILRQHANIFGIKNRTLKMIIGGVPKIKAPTCIIWGRQDRLLPPRHAQQALAKLPNAKLHLFDHCGHVPQMEVKDEFNKLLVDFLASS